VSGFPLLGRCVTYHDLGEHELVDLGPVMHGKHSTGRCASRSLATGRGASPNRDHGGYPSEDGCGCEAYPRRPENPAEIRARRREK